MRPRPSPHPAAISAAIVTAFGAAALLWCLGFFARMPPFVWPSPLLAGVFVLVWIGAGRFAARQGGGWPAAVGAGLALAVLNLLILGSLLTGDEPNELLPSAVLWVPGFLAAGAALGAVGGALARGAPASRSEAEWTALLARIAATATLALVFVGGLVTSREAGLAVVDWPNSYGYHMFLYPLSRMTGGVYYEHAHRLFGSLVGLTTLALAARILRFDARGSVKLLAIGAVVLVIGQGILGGLRVTGHFTWSDSPDVTRPNLTLAMVHGVAGQVFFAWMVAIAAVCSRTWRERTGARTDDGAGTDRSLAATLLVVLVVQLILGVRARHLGEGVMAHMTFAVVVLGVAVALAARLVARNEDIRALRSSGAALLGHVGTQVVLGFLAYVAVARRGDAPDPTSFEVWIATLHQTVGSLLFANAALVLLWTHRLVAPLTAAPPAPSIPASERS